MSHRTAFSSPTPQNSKPIYGKNSVCAGIHIRTPLFVLPSIRQCCQDLDRFTMAIRKKVRCSGNTGRFQLFMVELLPVSPSSVTTPKNITIYKGQYIALNDDDPNTVTDRQYDPIQLNNVQEQYHRWMDVSYMCLAGLFVLQIIDANVDAHLFYYDVSDDLTMSIRPSLIYTGEIKPAIGIGIHF
jgi:hypothetical protein